MDREFGFNFVIVGESAESGGGVGGVNDTVVVRNEGAGTKLLGGVGAVGEVGGVGDADVGGGSGDVGVGATVVAVLELEGLVGLVGAGGVFDQIADAKGGI